MKRLTMLFVMLLGVVTMTFADNVKDGVKSVKETATAVSETVNEIANVVTNTADVVNETTKVVKEQAKVFEKTTGVSVTDGTKTSKTTKTKTVEVNTDNEAVKEQLNTIEDVKVDVETATGNVDKYLDRFEKYGKGLKDMVVDIFEYSKQPAKDLFNLFVWKVRIYGLVDLGLMLLFITLTIMFGRWMWKGLKIMSRRAIQKKKTTFHILLGTILNFSLAVLFLFMSLSYVKNTKQIMMDSIVPEYQAIKDVAVVFGTATGSQKTKDVADSMSK